MLIVRFSRIGKKNHVQFRIVLMENSAAVKSKPIEVLGSYNPHQKEVFLKENRIKYWISQGVCFSDSAYNLMVSQGVIKGKKRTVKMRTKSSKEEEIKAKSSPAEKGQLTENKKEETKESPVMEETKDSEKTKPEEFLKEEVVQKSDEEEAKKLKDEKKEKTDLGKENKEKQTLVDKK